MLHTMSATTNAHLARLDLQLEPPDYIAIFNGCFTTTNGISASLAEIWTRLFNLERVNDLREDPDVLGPQHWRDDYDFWASNLYQDLVDHFGHLDARLSIIEMRHFQWNRASTNPAAAGLITGFDGRLTVLEQPAERFGLTSQETRLTLLEASASSAAGLEERFQEIEDSVAEHADAEDYSDHDSSPPLPSDVEPLSPPVSPHSFSHGAVCFQTYCKNQ